MPERPYRVFLSATSADLKSLRALATATLESNADKICPHGRLEVVVQETFPPDYRAVWDMLRQKILDCDAVICLVGFVYGSEPANPPPGMRRRSYTQLEFDIARILGKPIFLFPAVDPAALDTFQEADDLRKLQENYREELKTVDQLRNSFCTKEELVERLQRLRLPRHVAAPPTTRKPNNLPYRSLGRLFKGRDQFLADLRARLGASDGRAVGVLAAQALHGLGGVGKTRLAVEYGWRNESDYTALLFVVASSIADLRRNLAELCGPLVLDLKEVEGVKEEETRVAAAVHWLETHPNWFLILDNVDSDDVAREAERLLTHLRWGHVVITSRIKNWGADVERLELDVLDPDDSAAFLLERTARDRLHTTGDESVARELARALDGLALALEQAGAFICTVRCSLAQYLARWRSQEPLVLEWFDEHQMKYPKSVATTWQTTWDQLSPAARALMEILAWFAPDPIPETAITGETTRTIAVKALRGADVSLSLAELEKYSLVTRESAGDGWALLVHRLVQEITRRRLPGDLRQRRLESGLQLVDAAATGWPDDVRSWPVREPLSPHIRALVDAGEKAGIDEPTARLMNDLAGLLWTKALYPQAEPLYRRALAIGERSLGPDHTTVATHLSNLALLLKDTNRPAEAEPLFRRALAIDERSYGPDHPEVATDVNNLAVLLQATNRLAEAEPLFRRALAIGERSLGPDHPAVAIRLNNLAVLLQDTNRLAEAEPLLRRALAIGERSFGPDHPAVATDVNNLAVLLLDTNRLAEAEPLLRRAVAIDERSYGPDHPKVATDVQNLARLLQDTNRLAEAEPLSERAVRIFDQFAKRTGYEHRYSQAAENEYRGILRSLGHSDAEIEVKLSRLKADPL
jgi:tetratricopeptide (TPR) repeat protein